MLSTTNIQLPTPDQLKTLTLTDLAIMNKLSVSLREQIKKHIDIDPFTTEDPFKENDDYEYSLILDKTDAKRVICMIASKKEAVIQLPWEILLRNQLVQQKISKTEAASIKNELMPKDTNNFYPSENQQELLDISCLHFKYAAYHNSIPFQETTIFIPEKIL